MNLYLDTEFTGLHQRTTLISLALVAEDGRAFYAEFSDYDASQCDDWIATNVLDHSRWLRQGEQAPGNWREGDLQLSLGDSKHAHAALAGWLQQFDGVEIWADCPAWDWVLFCELFGGTFDLPKNIYFLPFDLVTLFKARGIDPDTDRAAFAGWADNEDDTQVRHNALYDARLVRACHQRLMGDKNK